MKALSITLCLTKTRILNFISSHRLTQTINNEKIILTYTWFTNIVYSLQVPILSCSSKVLEYSKTQFCYRNKMIWAPWSMTFACTIDNNNNTNEYFVSIKHISSNNKLVPLFWMFYHWFQLFSILHIWMVRI